MIELNNKVAIITGASRGIGLSISTTFGSIGATIVPIARSFDCDVTNKTDVHRVIGPKSEIDILVNCAGLFSMANLENDCSFDEVMNTNVRGAINCIEAVLPVMKKQRSGKIINISSIDAIRGFSKHAIYAASKGAIVSLTRELAVELGRYNINVNCVCPGFVKTEMTEKFHQDLAVRDVMLNSSPLRRVTDKQSIANMVAFFASDLSDDITGQIIAVDCGVTA